MVRCFFGRREATTDAPNGRAIRSAFDPAEFLARVVMHISEPRVQFSRAAGYFERALEFNEIPTYRVGTMTVLADTYRYLGRSAEVEECFGRALEAAEATFGPNHKRVAYPPDGAGKNLCAQSRKDEASRHFARWLALTGNDNPEDDDW